MFFLKITLINGEGTLIETEETNEMGKERKSGLDIVRLIADFLTEEEQMLYALSEQSGLDHGTLERYLKLICEVQNLFADKHVQYKEHKMGKKTYKSSWYTKKD